MNKLCKTEFSNNFKKILCYFKHNSDVALKCTRTMMVNPIFERHKRYYCQNLDAQTKIYEDLLKLQNKTTSNSIIEKKVQEFCNIYKSSTASDKHQLFQQMACQLSFDYDSIRSTSKNFDFENIDDTKMFQIHAKFRPLLTPKYNWMFIHVGRLENGVKFLVDMRKDLLNSMNDMKRRNDECVPKMQLMNTTLKDLLYLWFSVGFLKLERLTWKSSCEMLQKISVYEAVHPIHNWSDLKHRLGPYRRCFVYTHNSMPGEPIVVLHTILQRDIISSMSGITIPALKTDKAAPAADDDDDFDFHLKENAQNVRAAIFYSITSPHKGLQGIELGNYLIKHVVRQLLAEFPCIEKFSTLSPVPKFRQWLFGKLKAAEKGAVDFRELFSEREMLQLQTLFDARTVQENVFSSLRKALSSNVWLQSPELVETLERPLKSLCARYLYVEKNRGYALDSVANFHLRNGAEIWRINWLADVSARGLTNSCGIMVNYRYFLDTTKKNSQTYIEEKLIQKSARIDELL